MGSRIIPAPCGSIPNLSPTWSRSLRCHLKVALVTPGDAWVALPPPVSWHRAMGGYPHPSLRDEELRVGDISPWLGGGNCCLQNQEGALESIPKDELEWERSLVGDWSFWGCQQHQDTWGEGGGDSLTPTSSTKSL